MTGFYDTFHTGHVVLPVIHVESEAQALRNAETAVQAGADGVFLISMAGAGSARLLQILREVKAAFPDLWLGVNLLGETAADAFALLDENVSGLWTDNAHINELSQAQPVADAIQAAREKSGWKGLYFGGVAFKYQRRVANLTLAAQVATRYMDVVTTSGDGTGFAPDHAKIAAMQAGAGDIPIAIASGVSPENVAGFRDVAHCFLVATSLLKPGTEDFMPSKVVSLVRAAKG